MTGRYIAFDVETPNYANDRISAIGVTVVEEGTVVEPYFVAKRWRKKSVKAANSSS